MRGKGVTLSRRLVAEGLGSMLLLAIVIGSGIMGERLAGGNVAIALLGNTIATGAGLVVLIHIFGPVSGAHFNPAVTLAMLLRGAIDRRMAALYMAVQTIGAILGAWLAHAMFAEPLWQVSSKLRDGPGQGLAEAVATFGLIGTILGTERARPDFTAVAVGLYIISAYWFTASTSFANPAVTASVPLFVAGQLVGAAAAVATFGWLFRQARPA
jgi:glycerol uptake facilitator-like aquaporin